MHTETTLLHLFGNPDIFDMVADMLPVPDVLVLAQLNTTMHRRVRRYLHSAQCLHDALSKCSLQLDSWLCMHATQGKSAPLLGTVEDVPVNCHPHGPIVNMLRQAALANSTAGIYTYYIARQSPAGFARLCQHMPDHLGWLASSRRIGAAAAAAHGGQYVCTVPGSTLPPSLRGTCIITKRTVALLKRRMFFEYPDYRAFYAPAKYMHRPDVYKMTAVRDSLTGTFKFVVVPDMAGSPATVMPSQQAATTMPSQQPTTMMPSQQAATAMPSQQAAMVMPSQQAATVMPSQQPTTMMPSQQAAMVMPSQRSVYGVYRLLRSVLLLDSQLHCDADGWCPYASISV